MENEQFNLIDIIIAVPLVIFFGWLILKLKDGGTNGNYNDSYKASLTDKKKDKY